MEKMYILCLHFCLLFYCCAKAGPEGTISLKGTAKDSTGICQNAQSPVVVFSGSGAGPGRKYKFIYTLNNVPDTTLFTSANTNTIQLPVSVSVSGNYIFNLITVIDSKKDTAIITGQTVTVTVNPNPTVIATASVNAVCAGDTVNLMAAPIGGSNSYNYLWKGPGIITGDTLQNPASVPAATAVYSVTVTDGNGCLAKGQTAPVTVNPIPVIDFSNKKPALFCSGSTTDIQLHSTVAGIFTWLQTTGLVSGAGSGSSPEGSNSFLIAQPLNDTTNADTAMATFTISFTSGAGCPAQNKTIVVVVNPTPGLTVNNNTAQPFCSGSTTNIMLNATTAGTFTWPQPSGSIIGAGSGKYYAANGQYNISQQLVNSSNVSTAGADYRVSFVSDSGCAAALPVKTAVLVSPTPQLTINNNSANPFCSNSATDVVLKASTSGTFSFTAAFGKVTGGGGGSAGPGIAQYTINQQLTDSSNIDTGRITYTATFVSDSGCAAQAPDSVAVIVNPLPQLLTTPLSYTICSGSITNIFNTATTGNGSTFGWSLAKVTGGLSGALASKNPGANPIEQKLTSYTPTITDTVIYTVAPTSAIGCRAAVTDSVPITVIVHPKPAGPVFTLVPPQPICQNTINQNMSVTPSQPNYQVSAWQVIDKTAGSRGRVVKTDSINYLNAIVSFYQGTLDVRVTEVDTSYATKCSGYGDAVIAVNGHYQDTSIIIFNGTDYVCLNNTVYSYQWGWDDSITLVATTLQAGANFQNYFVGNGAVPANAKFWVRTDTAAGCYTKNYDDAYTPPPVTPVVTPGSQLNIQLVPNPALSTVNITWKANTYLFAGAAMVTITSAQGKTLIVQQLGGTQTGQNIVDVSRLPAGIYIVTVWDGNRQKAVAKLLKQ